MATKINVPKRLSVEKLESILLRLNTSSEDVDLQIPYTLDYTGFGILPNFYLVLFTWMRFKRGRLIIPIDDDNGEQVRKFVYGYYGYTVLSTLWRHTTIVNIEGKAIKDRFKDFTPTMHQYIDSLSEALPKESVLIPCFDHYSNEKGLSHWFYNYKYDFSETPSELDNSMYHIFRKISTNYKGRVARNVGDSFDDVTRIVWELLKNTDEHAKTDFLGKKKLLPNTRGLFMKIQRSSKSGFIDSTDHPGLKRYYNNAITDPEDSFILEISVFDSGPGLVKRFLGNLWDKEISIDKEIDTVRRCLIKGQTSVSTNEQDNKGHGLDEVLRLLDIKKGFLKIRTGRVSLYRDLVETPYKKTQDVHEISLYDWITCSEQTFTAMGQAEGCLITLAYPLI